MRFLAILILAGMAATGCSTVRSLTRQPEKPPKPVDPLHDLSKIDDTHHGTSHAVRKIDED
jgi:hypothetical protein